MSSVFTLTLSLEQAQAVLSALEREVEECVKADLRDRQSFGFSPVIHEDSARDRAYLDARRFVATSTLLAMQDAGVPYAAESLERARAAHVRIWAAFRREQEENALFARLDKDERLREAVRLASIALGGLKVPKNAKAHQAFTALDADVHSVLVKANNKLPGWARQVAEIASRARGIAHDLPERSAASTYQVGNDLESALENAISGDRQKVPA